ncbi:hypothetical protein MRB53_000966 [Persea americana]|uniref:Uncharacterized protein n=1 Tax=Persea americana TaxID=3435 RepID=A0ACC2MR16_PERAE|nr:hypothetical protein MRB53_000966 [Persea americana]
MFRASLLIMKHQESLYRTSWKDPEGHIINKTTKENAVALLKALRKDIVSGKARFEDVASRFSDSDTAKRGGVMGLWMRGQLPKELEDAAFALKGFEISEVLENFDGDVFIIQRTG